MEHIKKYNERTKELQKLIKDAKEKLLEEILNDMEISKVDKLGLISCNNLFRIDHYICNVFSEYYDEYANILKKNGDNQPCIDDYFHFHDYERHETIDLSELAESINEDYEGDELIIIMTNRTTDDDFKISKYEFIDTVYDWCVKNKKIGFEIDW